MSGWSFACPDWVERLKSGRSLAPDLPLDMQEAERAVAIFNKLRLPDVPGQPALADAAGEWFRDIVRAAFGSLDKATGQRRVSEVFCLVPKKNSKTTGAAALAITAMLMNKRPHAQMLLVGPTQEVADLAFQQAAGMIAADEYLDKRFHVREHKKTIEDLDPRIPATLKVKTFDMRVMTGAKPVMVIVDELHIMSTFGHASQVIGQIRGGLTPNPESLLIFITTQSDQPPAGVFKAELQYARGVRDGRITERVRMLPVLYEFPEAMQTDKAKPWRDPKNWPMVLPNLGRSITVDRLADDFEAARQKGEEEERRWASQHLNVEIGLALHVDRWRGADYWLDAADPSLTLESLIDRSEVITIGVDGGGLDDLFGLAVLGRCKATKHWLLWNRAWVHDDVLEKRPEIAERLMDFRASGDLIICENPTADFKGVAEIAQMLWNTGLLPKANGIGLDPAGIKDTVAELFLRGINEPAQYVPQGYKHSGRAWTMERKLKDRTLRHSGSAMMAWCVGNAKVVQQRNAISIDKEVSGKAKIDPLIAAFNAVELMGLNPISANAEDVIDVYDGYEVVTL